MAIHTKAIWKFSQGRRENSGRRCGRQLWPRIPPLPAAKLGLHHCWATFRLCAKYSILTGVRAPYSLLFQVRYLYALLIVTALPIPLPKPPTSRLHPRRCPPPYNFGLQTDDLINNHAESRISRWRQLGRACMCIMQDSEKEV